MAREPRIAEGSALELVAGRPQLTFGVVGLVEDGWVDVQWFAPDGHEAASESRWAELEGSRAPGEDGARRPGSASAEAAVGPWVLRLPDDVALVAGEWRAVVSMQGRFLRQFRLVVPVEQSD